MSGGYLTSDSSIPLWVEISAYSMIAFGTMWGGWKIIETLPGRAYQHIPNIGTDRDNADHQPGNPHAGDPHREPQQKHVFLDQGQGRTGAA